MRTLLLLAVFAFTALAADVTGTWKGTAETLNGNIERTFVFKADGTTLTGTTSSQMFGESKIENGKIDGDNLSFTVTVKYEDNQIKVNYTGKVSGNEMKLHLEADGGGFTADYTAKKIS